MVATTAAWGQGDAGFVSRVDSTVVSLSIEVPCFTCA